MTVAVPEERTSMTVAVPEALPTEFRPMAKHRPLESFLWDRNVRR